MSVKIQSFYKFREITYKEVKCNTVKSFKAIAFIDVRVERAKRNTAKAPFSIPQKRVAW